ncbi:porin family protein [Plebeiibacterium sediminum]|uniref:PorT family protein n=1 Tax=Plebeiibacterium sediminum TaxID=2992112 RepID=A0AAE3M807_9BACT|nr:porin family protein [Plebeiobacterium sediminum]MCW3788783.1 PorT family protein [Plebeiobacterium sediminum]
MKKLFLLSALLIFLLNVNAQNKFELGVKAGFNSTKIKLSSVPSTTEIKNEAKSGFLFGAYGKVKLFGDVSLQPEIYYAKKQTKYTFTEDTGFGELTVEQTSDIKTWDIPLLANVQLIDLKVAKIYGVAGPVASFITKDDLKAMENANWTFQAGGGVSIWKLSLDVRYEWGMKDVSKAEFGQKTDVLTFSLGYRLFGI